MGDPAMCVCACFFPCCFMSKLLEKIAPLRVCGCELSPDCGCLIGIIVFFLIIGTGWPFIVFIILIGLAARTKYEINEGVLMTMAKGILCPCCYLLQIYNHAEYLEVESKE